MARIREQKLKHNGNSMKELKKRIGLTKNGAGFTLVEILVAMAIIIIISGGSYVAFTKFNQRQTYISTYENLKNSINEAKSNALSQVINDCVSSETLVGYQIVADSSSIPDSYRLEEICETGGVEAAPNVIKTVKLPPNLIISSDISSILFLVLSGKVRQSGSISLSNGSETKTININSQGAIESETN